MTKVKVAMLMALVVGLCSFTLLGKHQEKPDKNQEKKEKKDKKLFVDYQEAVVTEDSLRRDSQTGVMPVYPEEAFNAGAQGLADVAVLFDENGDYKGMKVLDSPHPSITKAVRDALKQWKIRILYDSPYPENRLPIRNFAEVRFHFVIREGIGSVEPATPEEQGVHSQKFLKIVGPGILKGNDRRSDWPN